MFATFKKILARPARTAQEDWQDINNLTKRKGQDGLLKEALKFCGEMPKLDESNRAALSESLALLGAVMTKHILNSNTYTRHMTLIRQELTRLYGPDIIPVMISAKISDSERTKVKNAAQITRRNERHETSFNISISEIMDIIGAMVDDINSGAHRYRNTIVLLFELCTGARMGEVVSYGKFTADDDNHITQDGVLKRKSGSGSAEKLKIPTLYSARYLVKHLDAWRKANNITPGTYSMVLAGNTQKKLNQLLRARYLASDDENPNARIKTHLLRAVYANAAYKLAGGDHETLSGFIHRVLGHSGLETGLSYSFVKITDDPKPADHPGAKAAGPKAPVSPASPAIPTSEETTPKSPPPRQTRRSRRQVVSDDDE
jgi:integrase